MDYMNIQAEKATAMIRYRRLRNIAKMRRLVVVLVALAFFSRSSTRLPAALNLAVQFLARISKYLFNPHISLVIVVNAIIIVVVLLSRRNTTGSAAADGGHVFDFSSDELIPSPPPSLATEEGIETEKITACIDKRIVVSENVVRESVQCVDAVSDRAIEEEEGAKVIWRSFERTKSEKLMKRRSAPGRILRRSETVVVSSSEREITSFDAVDRLSNEDFRRTIEDVIAEHRRRLWVQKLDENEQ